MKGNADRTVHQGIELDGQLAVSRSISVGGNLALSRNYHETFLLNQYDDTVVDLSGNPVPLFPGLLGNGWVRWRRDGLAATFSVRTVGRQFLDSTNDDSHVVDPYTLLNLRLLWDSPAIAGLGTLTMKVAVDNLLNLRYETSGYWADWAGERYLYPASGRNFNVSLGLNL